MKNSELIEMIEKNGTLSRGKKSLIKHLEGNKIGRKDAMDAKCYDCMGYFIDGRKDCKMPNCPLFKYRPYKKDLDATPE
ncbi:MAG TPA: hypothetical protein ACFYEK_05945 [Candidatus Wunengus sp. YC60]|uniref:hypothetical protein n=1 Tax=Candidatus Wunengus sp. YC60 TaxID=3367697 RepID=UPI004025674E